VYVFPEFFSELVAIMEGLGLNPNVTTRDPSDPQGLANLVWDKLFPLMTSDGMNNLGDHGGVIYNRLNFTDYTGYEPVNRPIPFLMKDVDRWQPNIAQIETNSSSPGNRMYPRVQNFIQPQSKNVQSTLIDPRWIERNIGISNGGDRMILTQFLHASSDKRPTK